MHSSRMRTTRSLTVSPYLVISLACPPPPGSNHTCPPEQPHTPRSNHTCPPEQPCMPPGAIMHTPTEQPCMPPRSNQARPPGSNHTCPPRATMHAPRATMHAPGSNNAHPPLHPGATTHTPSVNRITDRCKNITFALADLGGRARCMPPHLPGILVHWQI